MSSGFYRIRPDACPTLYRLWLIDDIDIPTLMPMRLNFIYFFSMKFVLYLVCSHFYWIFRGHQLIYFIYHKLTPYPAGNLEHWACNLEQWASTLRVLPLILRLSFSVSFQVGQNSEERGQGQLAFLISISHMSDLMNWSVLRWWVLVISDVYLLIVMILPRSDHSTLLHPHVQQPLHPPLPVLLHLLWTWMEDNEEHAN